MTKLHSIPATPVLSETARTRLKRHKERGSYDRTLVHQIIDEALYCHIAFVVDGTPFVLPTAHARVGDALYLHGARSNRMLQTLCSSEAALTFTLLDGIVFARTAFHHSVNYRSVMLLARGVEVTDLAEKAVAASALIEHVAAGRIAEVGVPSDEELRATLFVRLPIDEASAKLRSGPPVDGEADLGRPCWAGELPLRLVAGAPRRAPELRPETLVSAAIVGAARAHGAGLAQPYEWQRGDCVVSTDRSRLDFELVHTFLAQAYWARGITQPRLRTAIEHSIGFGLYRGAAQIGFARVVTDFARFAYLADVFVLEAERGRGLGSWLMQCVLAHPDLQDVQRFLLGTRDAHAFYERLGFSKDAHGRFMEILGSTGA
jgi:nitroimidazol reductase NimA-like FMN-containing flavoprotein (pyridoxamine 5'-phosphate oxidase superfamily)/GNAT superfamily N-acetyltransferase